MSQPKLVRPSTVKVFQSQPEYGSKMLLDNLNSDSLSLHINQGILKAGTALPGGDHRPPFDEVYVVQEGSCVLEVGDEVFQISVGDIIFIPAGTYHRLDNTKSDEDLVILTLWPGTPPTGVNPVYDDRLKAWGKSFKTVDED